MKTLKITVKRMARYDDLMAQYENPIEHACDLKLGQTFIVKNAQKPEGLCDSAWETLLPFVKELAEGGGNFFDGWMKNPHSAMLSCNDGFLHNKLLRYRHLSPSPRLPLSEKRRL